MQKSEVISQRDFSCRRALLWDFLASFALFLALLAVYA